MAKSKINKVEWIAAPDIKKRTLQLIESLNMDWINIKNIHFIRSNNSKSRAYARIWGLSRVWQMTLNLKPSYIIEVLNEKFDKLSEKEKDRVLIHELTHIPQNFSGSLLPHIRKRGKRNFNKKVKDYFDKYLKNKTND
ncbi:MAG: metallopeptidase [Candidatus Delongbacteria bacterium]|nr:metallopeptidase [Candidatus Delongbacteria bacterium]